MDSGWKQRTWAATGSGTSELLQGAAHMGCSRVLWREGGREGGKGGGREGREGEKGRGREDFDSGLVADLKAHRTPGECSRASLTTLHIGCPCHMRCTPWALGGPSPAHASAPPGPLAASRSARPTEHSRSLAPTPAPAPRAPALPLPDPPAACLAGVGAEGGGGHGA